MYQYDPFKEEREQSAITALRSALDAAEKVEDQLAAVTKERDDATAHVSSYWKRIEELEKQNIELSRNTCQLGTCVKCGNPAQDSTKEHFVDATASEGVSPPEDSRPQRVEAPHHFSQPANMVDRIADILVEDHIALMKECEQLRRELSLERKRSFREQLAVVMKERDELVAFIEEWLDRQGTDENYMTAKAKAALAKAGAGGTAEVTP